MTDALLVEAFERGGLAGLPHADHVRLAWIYVRRDGPDAALEAMSRGLRRFATAKGVPEKYHHTITCAWIRLVAAALSQMPAAHTFERFVAAHPYLLDRRALDAWYSPELLATDTARKQWVEPDRLHLS